MHSERSNPRDVLYRLHAAQNQHDLDALADCFAPDYKSEQPAHPGAEFAGRAQVRKNWGLILESVPDLQSELLRSVVDGDTVWAEWRWCGTRRDGVPHELRGITIFRVEDNQIQWTRMYMEPMQAPSDGIDTFVQSRLGK